MSVIRNEGKDIAVHFNRHASSYKINKFDRQFGTSVAGYSPDGRYTGTCDRCCTAILNVHVFQSDNPEYPGYMHVGIDCAQKMGVPAEELRQARTWVREYQSRQQRAIEATRRENARLSREESNRAKYSDLLERIERAAQDQHASDYERDWCAKLTGIILNGDFHDNWTDCNGYLRQLESIEMRQSLCRTSKAQIGKRLPVQLYTVYRRSFAFDGLYGLTIINFLMDAQGNAYVYKGSRSMGKLDQEVSASFGIKGVETRDGLTSTLLTRPTKVVFHDDEEG